MTTKHYWPRQGSEWGNDDPWEMVPAWHPAKWLLGYDVRARCHDVNFHIGDDHWCYGHSQQVARRLLHECYDPNGPFFK